MYRERGTNRLIYILLATSIARHSASTEIWLEFRLFCLWMSPGSGRVKTSRWIFTQQVDAAYHRLTCPHHNGTTTVTMSKDTKPIITHSHPVEDEFNWSLEADWAPVEKKIGNFLVAVSMLSELPLIPGLTANDHPRSTNGPPNRSIS